MNPTKTDSSESVLREWRTRTLNIFTILVAVAAAPAWVMIIITFFQNPDVSGTILPFTALYALLVALAVFRRIDYRLRAWGLLLVGYVAAITNLVIGGLRGASPWYLLVLPIVGFILVSVRSGIILSVLSALVLAIFIPLFELGILSPIDYSTITPWSSYATFVMLLAIVAALMALFQRFQMTILERERRAHDELLRAQTLLEEQNATLDQNVQRRTQELQQSNKIITALYRLTEAANAAHNLPEFYAQVHSIVSELMYAKNLFIALYDEKTGLLSFPYFVDEQDEPFPTLPLADFHGMTSYVIRTGNSIKHGWDQFTELMVTKEVALAGSYNEDGIGAPLKAGEKVLGAIFVQSYTPGIHYTDQDDEVLAFIAQHIATALTRIRAIEDTRQRNAELEIINRTQEGLAARLDYQAIVDQVGDSLREMFTSDTFTIGLYDPDTNQFTAPYAVMQGQRVELPPLSPSGFSWQVYTTGKTLVSNRNLAAEMEKFGSTLLVGEAFPLSAVLVPIQAGSKTIGVVSAQNYDHEDAYPESIIRLLEIVAAHMGTALENARLFNETQRLLQETEQRNNELAILNNVGDAMGKTLDIRKVTRVVGDRLREIFNAESAMILLLDRQTNLIHSYYEYDKNEGGYMDYVEPFPLGTGLTSKVIPTGQPLMLGTLEEEIANGAYFPPEMIEKGAGNFQPILAGRTDRGGDEVLGHRGVIGYPSNAFNENNLRLMQTLASNMGVAMENARLFEAEQQRAAELAAVNNGQLCPGQRARPGRFDPPGRRGNTRHLQRGYCLRGAAG